MKVAVYFNLHKKTFSIKALEGDRKGLVVFHSHNVTLEDVTFKVSEAGRQRVLREKRKNVHAYVIGQLVSLDKTDIVGNKVTYNPYLCGSFVYAFDKEVIQSSSKAFLTCENKKAGIFVA